MTHALSRTTGMRLAVLCLAAAMVLAGARRGLASGGEPDPAERAPAFSFTITSPVAGDQIIAGSTITITWNSSSPSGNVNLYLGDVPTWTTYGPIVLNTPDDGSYQWQVPATIPTSQYLVYIEKVDQTDWGYGDTFDILECGSPAPSVQPRVQPRMDRTQPLPGRRPTRPQPRRPAQD